MTAMYNNNYNSKTRKTPAHVNKLAAIKDFGDAFEGFRQKLAPEKKALGAAIWQSGTKHFQMFFECKAQGNQHKIRIAFFERNKYS